MHEGSPGPFLGVRIHPNIQAVLLACLKSQCLIEILPVSTMGSIWHPATFQIPILVYLNGLSLIGSI
jgi:hypothetical protein